MGTVKAEMDRLDSLRGTANGVLLQVGAVTECPHGTLSYSGDSDAERKAYAYATQMVKRGEVDGSREEMMAAIKDAIDDSIGECGQCWKNAQA